MFRIGLFAKLNKVSVKTLRFYDQKGLLVPDHVDETNNYRYYSPDQMLVLNKILSLKELNFSLDEIRLIVQEDVDLDYLLELKILECQRRLDEDLERLTKMKLLKVQLKEANDMSYDIVIKTSEAIKVATLRQRIPSYSEQGPLWIELSEHIKKEGAKIVEPCMIIYHDSSEDSGVDAEVVEPIIGSVTPTDRIEVKNMIAGETLVSTVHKGPYDQLYLAYKALYEYVEKNGYTASGGIRELYLKGEWITSDTSEYITEIQLPVVK